MLVCVCVRAPLPLSLSLSLSLSLCVCVCVSMNADRGRFREMGLLAGVPFLSLTLVLYRPEKKEIRNPLGIRILFHLVTAG